jgi:hypothetical protein
MTIQHQIMIENKLWLIAKGISKKMLLIILHINTRNYHKADDYI